ncbi:unnamed protein product [Rangifer tarandus platyrhynchus]|uniref:Uncharacterized protein n=2 Tax=Rangifer tarandus platyrhynchus TaxID=3082113 RepID=A0ABN8Y9M6_RANTA|nr:unnamed protein product [Rangifer tarandus platyrhynchus]CAI9695875.1 unnamed protein product [Rangifer tarandus platyrhynchus]
METAAKASKATQERYRTMKVAAGKGWGASFKGAERGLGRVHTAEDLLCLLRARARKSQLRRPAAQSSGQQSTLTSSGRLKTAVHPARRRRRPDRQRRNPAGPRGAGRGPTEGGGAFGRRRLRTR